jgi:outer membrane immunogenic protein
VYFGSHIGGGWADVSLTESLFVAPVVTPLTQSFTGSGWLAGVHLGAMKQFGSIVTGVELNMDGADINGSAGNCAGGATVVCESKVNWLTTGLSRFGVAWDRWLVYGTVGYALAGVDHSVSAPVGGGVSISFNKQDVAHGIAFGGGLEFAVSKDLMLGVQYLHANLEARNEGLLFGGVVTNGQRDLDLDIVTTRLSYKFGGECCAPGPLK